MSKRIFSSVIVLIILNIMVFQSLMTIYAAKEENSPTEEASATEGSTQEEFNTVASLSETATQLSSTVQPTTYVKPLKFPSLSVSAISNFFGKANADYNQYTKEVTVIYYFKASKGVLTTQWDLSYDSGVLKIDPKKNKPEKVCPVIGKSGVITYNEGMIKYNATNVGLFDFSREATPFVKLVFDVKDIPEDEPQITKIDLSIDMLWLRDSQKECIVVNNYNVADLSRLPVSIQKNTSLTESNYVEPTTAAPSTAVTSKPNGTPDQQIVTEPASTAAVPTGTVGSTEATKPGKNAVTVQENSDNNNGDKPKPTVKEEKKVLIKPGNIITASLFLVLASGGMVVLLIMRKKVLLKLMLED